MQVVLRPVSLITAFLVAFCAFAWPGVAEAITAPELRGQRANQEISADMHGLDLKEKEFLKADLRDVNLSDTVHPWKMRSALTADFCNEND